MIGLSVMALFQLPSWSVAALRIRDLLTIDPTAPSFRMINAAVLEDERHALVSVYHERNGLGPAFPRVLRVDLETGAWSRIGSLASVLSIARGPGTGISLSTSRSWMPTASRSARSTRRPADWNRAVGAGVTPGSPAGAGSSSGTETGSTLQEKA